MLLNNFSEKQKPWLTAPTALQLMSHIKPWLCSRDFENDHWRRKHLAPNFIIIFHVKNTSKIHFNSSKCFEHFKAVYYLDIGKIILKFKEYVTNIFFQLTIVTVRKIIQQ